ncbi:MAG: Ferric reductase like transrane component [Actinomycetospora sp.]|nr:Ferric reductase like transrane component [Actinomycetospora sp.]
MSLVRVVGAVAVLGAAVLVVLALAGPHLAGAPVLLVVSTVAACLAVAALAVQPWLTRRPQREPDHHRARKVGVHVRVGGIVTVLVVLHVVALLVEDPDDALYSMSPDGPTRARMALIATLLLGVVTLLGVLRRRLRWSPATWRFVHGSLAALVVVLGVGHAVVIQGALDGWGTPVLLVLGGLGAVGAVVRLVRVLRAPPPPGAATPPDGGRVRSGDGLRG